MALYTEYCYAECRHAECRYAECRGALKASKAYIYSKNIRPKNKEHRQPIHLASKLGELAAPAR
jgi:hypothetical protein